jgi:hypothetical protein
MLQRIQTVFLLLVVILMASSLLFNVWEYSPEEAGVQYIMTPFALEMTVVGAPTSENTELPRKETVPYILLAVLAIAAITVAIIEITKFKNRLLQIKLGTLNSVILAAATILGVYFANDLAQSEELSGNYGIFIFLTPIALICNAIANRFIHRDEKLVRSVDRIR